MDHGERRRLARGDETRAALADAAIGLLASRAPSTISGRDIAEHAGRLYAHIYHQWGTKDTLLLAAVETTAAMVDPAGLLGSPHLGAVLRAACDPPWRHQADAMRILLDLIRRSAAVSADDPAGQTAAVNRTVAVVALRAGIAALRPSPGDPDASDRDALLDAAALLETLLLR